MAIVLPLAPSIQARLAATKNAGREIGGQCLARPVFDSVVNLRRSANPGGSAEAEPDAASARGSVSSGLLFPVRPDRTIAASGSGREVDGLCTFVGKETT